MKSGLPAISALPSRDHRERRRNYLLALFICVFSPVTAQTWTVETSNTAASLRAVSVVSAKVAWASGTKGTYLITADGGETWKAATVPGAADLDFRAGHACD